MADKPPPNAADVGAALLKVNADIKAAHDAGDQEGVDHLTGIWRQLKGMQGEDIAPDYLTIPTGAEPTAVSLPGQEQPPTSMDVPLPKRITTIPGIPDIEGKSVGSWFAGAGKAAKDIAQGANAGESALFEPLKIARPFSTEMGQQAPMMTALALAPELAGWGAPLTAAGAGAGFGFQQTPGAPQEKLRGAVTNAASNLLGMGIGAGATKAARPINYQDPAVVRQIQAENEALPNPLQISAAGYTQLPEQKAIEQAQAEGPRWFSSPYASAQANNDINTAKNVLANIGAANPNMLVTRDVVDATKGRLQNFFDTTYRNSRMLVTQDVVNAVQQYVTQLQSLHAEVPQALIDQLQSFQKLGFIPSPTPRLVQSGVMPGRAYQNIRDQLYERAKGGDSDAGNLIDSLDQAYYNSNPPAQMANLAEANQQYKSLDAVGKPLQRAAGKEGNPPGGMVPDLPTQRAMAARVAAKKGMGGTPLEDTLNAAMRAQMPQAGPITAGSELLRSDTGRSWPGKGVGLFSGAFNDIASRMRTKAPLYMATGMPGWEFLTPEVKQAIQRTAAIAGGGGVDYYLNQP
jgi:hypothetical protein